MPVISYFFGIYIRMYHDDHNPPHFHIEYQGYEALMVIETGSGMGKRTSGRIVDRLAICD
jgi:Domain of unknown function (DUF4160)